MFRAIFVHGGGQRVCGAASLFAFVCMLLGQSNVQRHSFVWLIHLPLRGRKYLWKIVPSDCLQMVRKNWM
jgi:hypothetical protein